MRIQLKFCLTAIWPIWLILLMIQSIKSESFIVMLESQSYYLNEGQEVNLICPFLYPVWHYNNKKQQNSNGHRSFNIKAITPEEAGTYSCTSSRKYKKKHAEITLIVCEKLTKDTTCDKNYLNNTSPTSGQESTNLKDINRKKLLPVIRKEGLINQTVFEDDNVKFQCDVTSELTVDISWLKHDDKLNTTCGFFDSHRNPNAIELRNSSDDPNIITIDRVQSNKHQGWYTCIGANSAGETNSSSYLRILHKDNIANTKAEKEIIYEITDPYVEENSPQFIYNLLTVTNFYGPPNRVLILSCPATGYPLPNIIWTLNDTEIKPHIGEVTYENYNMTLFNITTEDSGFYKCKVCNILGCIERSTEVSISDFYVLPITSNKYSQNKIVSVNTRESLKCDVASFSKQDILWLTYTKKNESIEKLLQEVVIPSIYQIDLLKDVVILEGDPHYKSILTFANLTHEDEGWYTCIAANPSGVYLASIYMHVEDEPHPDWITIIAMVLIFLLGIIFIVFFLGKNKREWTKNITISIPTSPDGSYCDLQQMPVIKIEKHQTKFTLIPSFGDPDEYIIPVDDKWEVSRNRLSLGSTLGEGAFGIVVKANFSTKGAPNTFVAVKMVKEEHNDADMISLIHEMEVMKIIGNHKHIINLLGCCTQNGPKWVIVELAAHGNLKEFLKKNRPSTSWDSCGLKRNSLYEEDKVHLSEEKLTSFAFQIAQGMEYLASKRCVHRDLAARNVLVSDDYIMKIADFGLARDIQDKDYYRKITEGLLPVKWMAPESLQEQFYDSKSDVWSYGVLLWEIMTYGETPYPNIRTSIEELYSFLESGQRLEKPSLCSLNIYNMMRQCWNFDSNARPAFMKIVKNLYEILHPYVMMHCTVANAEYTDGKKLLSQPNSFPQYITIETLKKLSFD